MAEYIERETAIEFIRINYCKDCNSYNGVRCRACSFDDAMLAIEDVAAADVVEVRRGKWVLEYGDYGKMICSECKKQAPITNKKDASLQMQVLYVESPYCPNCGAKMDGKEL